MAFNRTIQNLFAATQAAWNRRTQTRAQNDLTDQSIGNGYDFTWCDPGYNNEIPIIEYDSNGLMRLGNAGNVPQRRVVTCHLYPNANLVAQSFFVNCTPNQLVISGLEAVFTTAGSVAGAAGTITHETVVGGLQQAAGAGKSVLTGTFDFHATAATVQTGVLGANYLRASRSTSVASATPGTGLIVLQPGDSLSFKPSGTLTTLVGVTISVFLAPGGKYHFASYYLATAGGAATLSLLTLMRTRTLMYGAALWQVKEATAGSLTLDVTKDASATAPGAGTTMLASTVNLKSAALTYTQLALSATAANLTGIYSDSVAVKLSAGATELAGVLVTLAFSAGDSEVQIDYNAANSTVGTNEEFAILDRDYLTVSVGAKWSTAGGAGCTAQVTMDAGTNTPGSGGLGLHTAFDCTGTANTPVWGTLAARQALYGANTYRLGLKNAGTTSPLAGLQLSVLAEQK